MGCHSWQYHSFLHGAQQGEGCDGDGKPTPSVLSRVVTVEVTCLSPAATHSAAMHCATDSWAAFPVLCGTIQNTHISSQQRAPIA